MDFKKEYNHHHRDNRHHYQQQQSSSPCHCCNASISGSRSELLQRNSRYYSLRLQRKIGLLSILFLALLVSDTRATVVQTKIGKIRGLEEETPSTTKYYAFKGIRYASSPVKELRFRVIISSLHWFGYEPQLKEGRNFAKHENCWWYHLTLIMDSKWA